MRGRRLGYRRTRLERVPSRGSSPSSVSFRVPVATEDASLLPTLRSRGIGQVGLAGKLIRIELARLTTQSGNSGSGSSASSVRSGGGSSRSPLAIILSTPGGNGRWSVHGSVHGARIHTSY